MIEFDAFISYSSRDKPIADAACAALEAAGIRCWIAPRDILAGSDWGASIVEALDHCRVMVLIFSSSANTSPQIRREIERVVNRGIPVVPVRIEDIQPTKAMAYFMGPVHWLDALTPPLEQHLKRLAPTIRSLVGTDVTQLPVSDGSTATKAPTNASEHIGGGSPAIDVKPDRKLRYPILIAIGIGICFAIFHLLTRDVVHFIIAAALTAVGYWFIYRKLADDVATAKIASLVCAGATGYFILVNIAAQNILFAAVETVSATCLVYVFVELSRPPSQSQVRQ
jgi:TIR domain